MDALFVYRYRMQLYLLAGCLYQSVYTAIESVLTAKIIVFLKKEIQYKIALNQEHVFCLIRTLNLLCLKLSIFGKLIYVEGNNKELQIPCDTYVRSDIYLVER